MNERIDYVELPGGDMAVASQRMRWHESKLQAA